MGKQIINNEEKKQYSDNRFFFDNFSNQLTLFIFLFALILIFIVVVPFFLSKQNAGFSKKQPDYRVVSVEKEKTVSEKPYYESNRDLIERFLNRQSSFLGHNLTLFGILITVAMIIIGLFQLGYMIAFKDFIENYINNSKDLIDNKSDKIFEKVSKNIKKQLDENLEEIKKDISQDINNQIVKLSEKVVRDMALLSKEARDILIPFYRDFADKLVETLERNLKENCEKLKEIKDKNHLQCEDILNLNEVKGILLDLINKQAILIKLFGIDEEEVKQGLAELTVHPFEMARVRLIKMKNQYRENPDIYYLINEILRDL